MPPTKQQKRKNAVVQKEQAQLIKIQTELEGLMSKVSDALNILKVEELQLKSSTLLYENPQIKTENLQTEYCEEYQNFTDTQPTSSEINQQSVNLDVFSKPFDTGDIEEDDDI